MTGPGNDGPSASEQDHAYFRGLEDAFIRLRGAPLLLSPSDWQVAKGWRREGIPLELAVSVMAKIFDRQAEGGHEKTGIRGLRYFRSAIEGAWRRIVSLQGDPRIPSEPGEIDVPARLARLSAALPEPIRPEAGEDSSSPAAMLGVALEGVRERLLRLGGEAEEVERELLRIDREVAARLRDALSAEARSVIEERVGPALQRLSDRLPDERRRETAERLVDRYLRETLELPVLSLFSPEARAKAPPD